MGGVMMIVSLFIGYKSTQDLIKFYHDGDDKIREYIEKRRWLDWVYVTYIFMFAIFMVLLVFAIYMVRSKSSSCT